MSATTRRRIRFVIAFTTVASLVFEPLAASAASPTSADPTTTSSAAQPPEDGDFDQDGEVVPPPVRLDLDGSRLAPLGGTMFVRFRVSNASTLPSALGAPTTVSFTSLPPGVVFRSAYPTSSTGNDGWACAQTVCRTNQVLAPLGSLDGLATFTVAPDASIGAIEQSLLTQLLSATRSDIDKAALSAAFDSMSGVEATLSTRVGTESTTTKTTYKVSSVPAGTSVAPEIFAFDPARPIEGRSASWTVVAANPTASSVTGLTVAAPFEGSGLTNRLAQGEGWACDDARCVVDGELPAGGISSPLALTGVVPTAAAGGTEPVAWRPNFVVGSYSKPIDLDYLPLAESPPNLVTRINPSGGVPVTSAGAVLSLDVGLSTIGGPARDVKIVFESPGATFESASGMTCEANGTGRCTVDVVNPDQPLSSIVRMKVNDDAGEGLVITMKAEAPGEPADKLVDNTTSTTVVVREKGTPIPVLFPVRKGDAGEWIVDGVKTDPLTPTRPEIFAYVVKNVGAEAVPAGSSLLASIVLPGVLTTRPAGDWSCTQASTVAEENRPSEAILATASDAASAAGASVEPVDAAGWVQYDCSIALSSEVAPEGQTPPILLNVSAMTVPRSIAAAISARLGSSQSGGDSTTSQNVERVLVVDVPRLEVQSQVGDAAPARRGAKSKAKVTLENRGETAAIPVLLAAANEAAGIEGVEGSGLSCIRIGGSLAIGVAICRGSQSAPFEQGSEAQVSIRPQGPSTKGAWSYDVVPIAVGRSVVVGGTTKGLVRENEPLRIDVTGPEMVADASYRSGRDAMVPSVVAMYATHNGSRVTWSQTAGSPTVEINTDSDGNATFTAPKVNEPTTLTFKATTTDEDISASDSLSIRVEPTAGYNSPSATAQQSSFSSGTMITKLPFRADRPKYVTTSFRRRAATPVFYRRAFIASTPAGVDSGSSSPVEPWSSGAAPIRVRADSLGTGSIAVVPGAQVSVVGDSVAGVAWSWEIETGDSGVSDDPAVVAAVAGARGATLRFTAPNTAGTLVLRATVTLGDLTATDLVTIKVGDGSKISAVTFDVASRTRPLVVASGSRKDVVATAPAGATLTWGVTPRTNDVTVTPNGSRARITGTSLVQPLIATAFAVGRGPDGRINAVGSFPIVIAPAFTFATLCDITSNAATLLRSIPGASGLDLSAEITAASSSCSTGSRLTFSGKSFRFAGFGITNVSGSLDRNGLKLTGGTIDFPDSWPIDDIELNEASGSVITFRLTSGGTRLGSPSVRLQGRLSARFAASLTPFAGWTWKPTISIESGTVRSLWLQGDGPVREDGTRSTILARGFPAADGSTTFEVSATGVELVQGLRADISGSIGTGAGGTLNLRGSVSGSWSPFAGATMTDISLQLATGRPTTVSGTVALSVGGLNGLSLGATISISGADRWTLTVNADQTRDLTLVDGVVLRGATVSGSLTRNGGATSGSIAFAVASLRVNAFAEVSNLRAESQVNCAAGAACTAVVSVSAALILRTSTPTTISLSGSVDTATRTLRLSGSIANLLITSGITLTSASFTYENRAGVVGLTASATAQLFGTTANVTVSFNQNSTVVSGGINNLQIFGNGGPAINAEVAFSVDTDREVTWTPATQNLRALNLPAVQLPVNGIHLTASVTTPASFRTFLGNTVPERFVIRANYVGQVYTLLGREYGGQVSGTLSNRANSWSWDASFSLNGDFEFFSGARFRSPSIRIRGGGGSPLKFGLSGNLAINVTGTEFVVPFDLEGLDLSDWTINLQTPPGGTFSVEPIRGLRLNSLTGAITRRANQVSIAIAFRQGERETWIPFNGFTVSEANVSASATCPSIEALEQCATTLAMSGRITFAGGAVDLRATRDAAGWTLTAAAGSMQLAPGIRITTATLTVSIPNDGSVSVTATGTFNVLNVDLAASVSYNQQGLLLTAAVRGTWQPITGGPSFSDVSVAFSTYAIANFDPVGAPRAQALPANDPMFFGSVNMPASILRAVGLEGIRIEPVGLSLGNVSSGNFGLNIAINTGGPKWIVNFGGKGLKLTSFGIRLAMRNFVPTFGLYGEGELVVPSQPSGVPLVLDLTVTATGGLSVAATLGIDADGRERPWQNAFGVNGLVVRALAISFSLQPPNPFPGFGAGLSIELPASIRDVLGMSQGVVLTAILNVQVDSMCLSVSARGQRANDRVINILDGVLTATQVEVTFAPLGCSVGRMTVQPGIRAVFRGSVMGVPVNVDANVNPSQLSVEASVSLGAFDIGPLRFEETVFETGVYGSRPLDSYVRFRGGLSLGSTRVSASVDVRNDGFDISGAIDNLSLVPGLVEVKQARLSAGYDLSDTRLNLNVLGSVEVLRQALNVSLDVEVDRSGVRSLRGSVEADVGLGNLLRINGRFGFDMSLSNPSISVRGSVVAGGFNLLEVEGSINRNALSVRASTDMFGIFQGSVSGKVVWCNAGNTERIVNVAGQEIVAQSGDFFFSTELNVNMDVAGFSAQGRLKLGYSAPSGGAPQRQACGGNGQRAVGTPSTTTTTSSTTTTVPLVNRLPGNNAGGFNPGVASTVPRTVPAAVVSTTVAARVPVSTVAITAPPAVPRASIPPAVVTTAAPRTTTTVARATTTLAPSPPVAREFFGELRASFELGGSGFGGRVSISGMFSTSGDLTLRGSVNLDLTVATARANVEFTKRAGFVRFAIDTTVRLAGSSVALSGTFERSGRGTTFDLTGRGDVNLYVATVNVAFRVNNNGVVATARLTAGSRSWAYFSASVTLAFTRDGWLVDVSGDLIILNGLVEVGGRLAIGNLECNARMQCRSVRSFAKLTATFPIGPFQFRVDASLLNGFSLEVSTVWGDQTGRLDLGNCWGRAKWELSVTLYIRENPARNQARVELVGRAGVYGKLWGRYCWPGTPDNERDRWPYSVSASLSVTFDPWGVTVSVHLGVPNFTIGPVAGVRIRVT